MFRIAYSMSAIATDLSPVKETSLQESFGEGKSDHICQYIVSVVQVSIYAFWKKVPLGLAYIDYVVFV